MYEVCSADRATQDSQGHWVSEDHLLPQVFFHRLQALVLLRPLLQESTDLEGQD